MGNNVSITYELPAKLNVLNEIDKYIDDFFSNNQLNKYKNKDIAFYINLALTEAVANAILHGEKKKKYPQIKIRMNFDGNTIEIKVYSQGKPFKKDDIKKPNPLSDRGRGLYVINNIMDDLRIKRELDENILIMKKNIVNDKNFA
ncbi:MAG: ATP-binding protein [Deferribacterota bacterium]|nr:ATP-binding protein [Deferribacterota bacterium]